MYLLMNFVIIKTKKQTKLGENGIPMDENSSEED